MLKFISHLFILALSILALVYTTIFTNNTNSAVIPSSTNYLTLLKKIYLSTTINLQVLVFCFDFFCMLYHLYWTPLGKKLRDKLRQYSSHPYEQADFSSLCLTTTFIFIVKPVPLVMLLIFLFKGYTVLGEAITEYQFDQEDKPVIEDLREYQTQALIACVLNILLLSVYLVYCSVACYFTGVEIGSPKKPPQSAVHRPLEEEPDAGIEMTVIRNEPPDAKFSVYET